MTKEELRYFRTMELGKLAAEKIIRIISLLMKETLTIYSTFLMKLLEG